uniref:dolichol kinase n=1 Tax=Tetraselmis sp. GSL018 TaxID=582737 RepID=A0A061SJN7_9CHLO
MAYWAALLAASLPAIRHQAGAGRLPPIIVRKLYHLLAAAIFLPGALLERDLLSAAAAVACCALVALEVVRIGRLPPIGERVNGFMAAFADSRDEGEFLVSHFSLLIGMAAPVWLHPSRGPK